MQLTSLYFIALLSFIFPWTVGAQEPGAMMAGCTFSCPEADALSQPLVKRPNTIGYGSFYSVFECKFATPQSKSAVHTCTYDKISGAQRLGSAGDICPTTAIPCAEAGGRAPMFSNLEKDETPPWVEGGRSLLYYKEHQPL